MKIKSIHILKYGPLEDVKLDFDERFNLIYGFNEAGKTMIIEAITYLLLGNRLTRSSRKYFESYDRVKEKPNGLVTVIHMGKEYIFDGKPDITSVVPSLEQRDLPSIFVIRDSDLAIREKKFLTRVSERLSSIELSRISELKEIIAEKGNVTPGQRVLSSRGDERAAERVEKIKEILREIDELEEYIREKSLHRLYETLSSRLSRYTELNDKKEKLETLQKIHTSRMARNILTDILALKEKLKELETVDQELIDRVERLENKRENLLLRKEEIKSELEKLKNQIADLKESRRELTLQRDHLSRELLRLNTYHDISRELLNRLPLAENKFATLSKTIVPSSIIAGSFLLYMGIDRNSMIMELGSLLLFILATLGILYIFVTTGKEKERHRISARIRSETGYDPQSLLKREKELKSLLDETDLKLRLQEERVAELERAKERLDETLREIHNELTEIGNEVEGIYTMTPFSDLKELKLAYKEKIITEENLRNKFVKAGEILKRTGVTPPEEPQAVEKVLDHMARNFNPTEVDPEESFSEAEYEETIKEIEKLFGEIESIRSELDNLKRELSRISVKISSVTDKKVIIESPETLTSARKQLEDLLHSITHRFEMARTLLGILDEIEEEEMRFVTGIFEKQGISTLFSTLTKGRYTGVRIENGQITVIRRDNREFTPSQLSGATFDQLYFSIRLGLARALLGTSGFLILDDPFIKYDSHRLKSQFQMLRQLVEEEGWQIIYFSAKEEIHRTTLETFGRNVNVTVLENPPDFPSIS